MSSARPAATAAHAGGTPPHFAAARHAIADRLYRDSSFRAFDAMAQMDALTADHIGSRIRLQDRPKLWIGGSLGRREMLPNSDLDLFLLDDATSSLAASVHVDGADKFELGCFSVASVQRLLTQGSIDANRLIDGRGFARGTPADAVTATILEVNTTERQYANLVSEYFYYRYFDFPLKRTSWGPNLKYSSGSSRTTLLLNFAHRIATNEFPVRRADTPELSAALSHPENTCSHRPLQRAIDLLLVAKNAAITCWYRTADPSVRYVSRRTLGLIYELARGRWQQQGITSPTGFADVYSTARAMLQSAVDKSLARCLAAHPQAEALRAITAMTPAQIRDFCLHSAVGSPTDELLLVSFAAWRLGTTTASPDHMAQLAAALATRPLSRVWGGVMAVACAPRTSDDTLAFLTEWLADREEGAYLTKLVSRNPSAAPATRQRALLSYQAKETIRVT